MLCLLSNHHGAFAPQISLKLFKSFLMETSFVICKNPIFTIYSYSNRIYWQNVALSFDVRVRLHSSVAFKATRKKFLMT